MFSQIAARQEIARCVSHRHLAPSRTGTQVRYPVPLEGPSEVVQPSPPRVPWRWPGASLWPPEGAVPVHTRLRPPRLGGPDHLRLCLLHPEPRPAAPQSVAAAAAPGVAFAPHSRGAVPGALPEDAGTGTMADFEAQMLVEQALYELTQKPIIPNTVVFACAACYFLFVGTALITGSIFFTYRLKPVTPPDPPEQTDTTVTFFEATQSPKNWDVSSITNPLICLVDFITPANPAIKAKASVESFLAATYGTNSGVMRAHTGKILLTAYGPDQNLVDAIQNDVFNLAGIYIRFITNWDPPTLRPFFDEVALSLIGGLVLELHAADIPKIKSDVLGYVKFMVVVPPGVTEGSLAKLKVATLANPLRIMNDTIKEAVKDLGTSKICAAFTMSALKSLSSKGNIDNPGDPADVVASVQQTEACRLAGAQLDKKDISMYITGSAFYSFDTNNTMFEKVRLMLTNYNALCLAAVSVLDDNCPSFNMLKIMKMVFDKNFK
ncbi:hypothetical protein MTO96_023775 [Rhipicephalus appendiculatus]